MSDATFRSATEETPLARRFLIGLAVAGLAILVLAPSSPKRCVMASSPQSNLWAAATPGPQSS